MRFDSIRLRIVIERGIEFDSPLNRLAERNAYRAAQLDYQRARRDFMATQDEVAREIRFDLRALELDRFRFEVTRRQLIAAARQVELAQINLRNTQTPDSSLTRDLLNALQQLLSAKNNLIGSWVSYKDSKMNLFRDLAIMQIDSEGVWINEHDAFSDTGVAGEGITGGDASEHTDASPDKTNRSVPEAVELPAPSPDEFFTPNP